MRATTLERELLLGLAIGAGAGVLTAYLLHHARGAYLRRRVLPTLEEDNEYGCGYDALSSLEGEDREAYRTTLRSAAYAPVTPGTDATRRS